MTRTESKKWHEYFRYNLKERIKQLEWVLEATELDDKVLASRIGCIDWPTRAFVLSASMPSGLKDSLAQRYPNRMFAKP